MITPYNNKLLSRAKKLRNNSTLSEVLMWKQLKARKLMGYRFLRQKIIGNYIVDFFCPVLGLAIEIDGTSHSNKKGYDKFREEYLKLSGFRVLRFSNLDVESNIEIVVRTIEKFIKQSPNLRESSLSQKKSE